MKPIRIILPLIVFATVVTLFLLFIPTEPGFTYWFNFALSVLVFCGVSVYWTTPKPRHSVGVDIAIGLYLLIYAASLAVAATAHFALVEPGVIWVLADFPNPYVQFLSRLAPLFQENPAMVHKVYLTAILLLTAVTAVTIVLILHADRGHQERQAVQQERTRQQRSLAYQMQALLDGRPEMRNLATAFRSLTPNVLAKAQPELESLLSQTEDFLNGNPSPEEQKQYEQRTVRHVNLLQQQSKS